MEDLAAVDLELRPQGSASLAVVDLSNPSTRVEGVEGCWVAILAQPHIVAALTVVPARHHIAQDGRGSGGRNHCESELRQVDPAALEGTNTQGMSV